MKTQRRIFFEDRENGLKVYLNKNNFYEIVIWGKNVISFPSEETEFLEVLFKPKGLEIFMKNGKKMIFLFETMRLFFHPSGTTELEKGFLFGDVEAALKGELLQNYSIN